MKRTGAAAVLPLLMNDRSGRDNMRIECNGSKIEFWIAATLPATRDVAA
jgi:hypothetical protein